MPRFLPSLRWVLAKPACSLQPEAPAPPPHPGLGRPGLRARKHTLALPCPSYHVSDVTIPFGTRGYPAQGSTPHSCFKESLLLPSTDPSLLTAPGNLPSAGRSPTRHRGTSGCLPEKRQKGQRKCKFTPRGNRGFFFRAGRVIRPILSLADRK